MLTQPRSIDIVMFRSILEEIQARPQSWDQTSWWVEYSCGSSYCLAGHVVHRAGFLPHGRSVEIEQESDGKYSRHYRDVWCPYPIPDRARLPGMYLSNGELPVGVHLVGEVAANLLGLNWNDADYLFHPDRTLDELLAALQEAEIAQAPIEWVAA